ncbi:hypothetical protein [Paraburkholderia elongata]|uniref:Uncharacterized protein n=1 Tax=Paraburkholderia elongata TaxID=2675747 RepID=A0A972SL35_9BURK|nr:hypothetical protein [Paraburkholderia elongata]NPT58799.1 hypothetical protein [Paraburkholderia elongata]
MTVVNRGSCISSIPRIVSAAKDHEHDIHNARPSNPVYTGSKFNSLLGSVLRLCGNENGDDHGYVHRRRLQTESDKACDGRLSGNFRRSPSKCGPTDPRTLARAARDFAQRKPEFAVACGTAALHWMAAGFGYEITGSDVVDAYGALADAALATGMERDQLNRRLRDQLAAIPGHSFVATGLAHHWVA